MGVRKVNSESWEKSDKPNLIKLFNILYFKHLTTNSGTSQFPIFAA